MMESKSRLVLYFFVMLAFSSCRHEEVDNASTLEKRLKELTSDLEKKTTKTNYVFTYRDQEATVYSCECENPSKAGGWFSYADSSLTFVSIYLSDKDSLGRSVVVFFSNKLSDQKDLLTRYRRVYSIGGNFYTTSWEHENPDFSQYFNVHEMALDSSFFLKVPFQKELGFSWKRYDPLPNVHILADITTFNGVEVFTVISDSDELSSSISEYYFSEYYGLLGFKFTPPDGYIYYCFPQ